MGKNYYEARTDRIILFDDFVWGTPKVLTFPTKVKDLVLPYRGSRIWANVPQPGMMFLNRFAIDDQELLVERVTDAYIFAGNTFQTSVSMPTVHPHSTLEVEVSYSGLLPPSYKFSDTYDWVLAIRH